MSQPSYQPVKGSLEERVLLSLATLQSRNTLNTSCLELQRVKRALGANPDTAAMRVTSKRCHTCWLLSATASLALASGILPKLFALFGTTSAMWIQNHIGTTVPP